MLMDLLAKARVDLSQLNVNESTSSKISFGPHAKFDNNMNVAASFEAVHSESAPPPLLSVT